MFDEELGLWISVGWIGFKVEEIFPMQKLCGIKRLGQNINKLTRRGENCIIIRFFDKLLNRLDMDRKIFGPTTKNRIFGQFNCTLIIIRKKPGKGV
jgi:hypothetical protein